MPEEQYKPTQGRKIGSVLVEVSQRWVWIMQDGRTWKFPHTTFKGSTKEQILSVLKCDKWTAVELETFFKEWLPIDRRLKTIKIHNATDLIGEGATQSSTTLEPPVILKDGTKISRHADKEFLDTLTDAQFQEYTDILMEEP